MIVKPKIRGFICTTAHPVGCERHIEEQINYVKKNPSIKNGPKKVLVIGASTGYGLASRIVAAFGCRASTMGVYFEQPAENKRTATAGWYNAQAFQKFSKKEGLYFKDFNGDAFSDTIKQQVIDAIRQDWGKVDLIIYSVAAPRRLHPKTGQVSKSTLKPIGPPYTNKSIDFMNDQIISITLQSATPDDVQQTIDVMGGEDWAMWMNALEESGLLADGVMAIAYSYIGPEVTTPVYRNGTIGAAKEHLETTARQLNDHLQKTFKGHAYISVNKALVTQSSSAIPFIPLYFTILMKVMKEKGLHEDCIQQMYRLFAQRIYSGGPVVVDAEGRIRVDDFEMREDVQREVNQLWEKVSNENVFKVADVEGYHKDFLKLFGFGIPGVDYEADVET
ncbi:MAG: trans-2-enoyl-CoA reductase family protein [Candidatus Omnitrophica bacterium]|nr:trans-2-enoyl-CoA reductase family protein [Candidatus Omnitrophota bacterium]